MPVDDGWLHGRRFRYHGKKWVPSFNPLSGQFGLSLISEGEHCAKFIVSIDGAAGRTKVINTKCPFVVGKTCLITDFLEPEKVKDCIDENNEWIIKIAIDYHS